MCAAYAELHAHSAFSFLDGASQPDELATAAVELGHTHMALTDHDGVSGSLEFAHAAKAVGLTAISGAEVTVVDDLQRTAHVTLLVRTAAGWRNLCRLLTLAHAPRTMRQGATLVDAGLVLRRGEGAVPTPADLAAAWTSAAPPESLGARRPAGRPPSQPNRLLGTAERPTPLVSLAELEAHAEGLVLLTGCARHGLLLPDLAADRPSRAVALVERLQRAFGREHVHVELQLPQARGDAARCRALQRVAELANAGVVATGNVHAHTRARARLHEVLVAARLGVTLEACEVERAGNLAHLLRTPEEMVRRFRDYPEAVSASRRIAEGIEFDLTTDLGYSYPDFGGAGRTPDERLAEVCERALLDRYVGRRSEMRARNRLTEELAIIRRHGLGGFFLLHHDVLELAREVACEVRGPAAARAIAPPGRGRGSSVESIVCFLTGLSHIDPIEAGLTLGRFLNDEMPSMPDIDLDFARDIRHGLLARVASRYGADRCAMVAAHATFKAKGAIRWVGAALGLPQAELARIAARTDGYGSSYVHEAVDARLTGPRWDAFRVLTREVAGLPRQIGQHSGGVIVATEPLCDLVPIMPTAMPGRQICQWDKDSCSDAGFLKIDVLGLGMLSSVEECLETVAETTGTHLDLARIDLADPAVYAEIQAGDTIGTFQIESRAQIQSIKRVKPENLHDLTIQVALIRPGPIIGQSVNGYVQFRERKRVDPRATPTYDHPLLEPVLADTYGAIIFQDQVIEVAMAISGFSAGEADGLRRAMTRKRAAGSVEAWRGRFLDGAAARGVEPDTATRVFDKLIGFCHYGFPRAHSVAFALLAYQSQWLRHHYPAQFVASLMNAQPMGFYTPDSLLRDAARHAVAGLPACVNASDALTIVERHAASTGGFAIRVGLAHVKGVAYEDALSVQQERERGGPFTSIEDLARRLRLREPQLAQLVRAGATECFGQPRREQLWQLGMVARVRREAGIDQQPLELGQSPSPQLRQLELWEQVGDDFATHGLSVRAHPVGLIRGVLPDTILTLGALETVRHGSTVEVVGAVTARQKPATAKGTVFLLLEDETGTANVIVNASLYKAERLVIRGEPVLRVRGRIERHGDVWNLVASGVRTIPRELRRRTPAIKGKFFG